MMCSYTYGKTIMTVTSPTPNDNNLSTIKCVPWINSLEESDKIVSYQKYVKNGNVAVG